MAVADRLYWLHALTPLHVGAGKGNGYIDLPLIREKVTGYPFVPGSSTKGVFADDLRATDDARNPNKPEYRPELQAAFGTGGDNDANAGSLMFTDARLVCLPVRSLYGTFAWCTCPLILARLRRDLALISPTSLPDPGALAGQTLAPETGTVLQRDGRIFLEDLQLSVQQSRPASQFAEVISAQVFKNDTAWCQLFKERFLVLPDDVFSFLAETGTEVQAHVRIDPDYKRVARGALWYEESLPAESILSGVVTCAGPYGKSGASRSDVLNLLNDDRTVQMGGKATTGKGQLRLLFRDGGAQ